MTRLAHLAIVPMLLLAMPAQALLEVCSASTDAVAFGSYNPLSSGDSDTTGTVRVTCTALVSIAVNYTIRLGTGGSGSYAPRKLAFLGNTLSYNLYTGPTRTSVWGDGTGSTQTISDGYALALLLVTRSYPIYGRLFAGQNATPGLYADTVVVTIDY